MEISVIGSTGTLRQGKGELIVFGPGESDFKQVHEDRIHALFERIVAKSSFIGGMSGSHDVPLTSVLASSLSD